MRPRLFSSFAPSHLQTLCVRDQRIHSIPNIVLLTKSQILGRPFSKSGNYRLRSSSPTRFLKPRKWTTNRHDFSSIDPFRFPHRLSSSATSPQTIASPKAFHSHDPASKATIFASSSGTGRSGVLVIRISGPAATKVRPPLTLDLCGSPLHCVLDLMLDPPGVPRPRYATLRKIVAPRLFPSSPFPSEEPTQLGEIDKGVVLYFPGPNSFTGEDVVELQLHGSVAVYRRISTVLQSPPMSFSFAEPGEFTRRAFMNGKMDLREVEGMADLLAAETEQQRLQALQQLSGEIGDRIRGWRNSLADCLARIEALIDFGEDEHLDSSLFERVAPQVREVLHVMERHLSFAERGELIRSGLRIAIVGPPNAGKSSLLNSFANQNIAIVSPIAGTTRDVVETHIDVGGFPVVFADTAGINESLDPIEMEGVRRAKSRLETSHVVLGVFDITDISQSNLELLKSLASSRLIVVLNKIDLLDKEQVEDTRSAILTAMSASGLSLSNIVTVSCQTDTGLNELLSRVKEVIEEKTIVEGAESGSAALITRSRHRALIEEAVSNLHEFFEHEDHLEIASDNLRIALDALGRMVGRVDAEAILDRIFKEFCIGK